MNELLGTDDLSSLLNSSCSSCCYCSCYINCYILRLFLSFFFIKRVIFKNGRTLFGAKYGRTKGLTGKELSLSFRHIRPGVFAWVRKTVRKVGYTSWTSSDWKFRPKRFIMRRLTSNSVNYLYHHRTLESCKVNRQLGVVDSKYVVTSDDPLPPDHVTRRTRNMILA